MVFGHGFVPFYAWPSEALEDLRKMGRLAYLHLPGRKNRIRPEVLLGRHEERVRTVRALEYQLEAAEVRALKAGIDTTAALLRGV
jgi:hypothetical protein